MDLAIVKQWILAGEGLTLDFKEQSPLPYKIARTIGAFANSSGGKIVIGVTDQGEIVGVVDIENEKKRILEAAKHYCYPPVAIDFKVIGEAFIKVLVIHIEESTQKPHASINENGSEQVYIRTKDKTMPASKMVVKVLENEQHEEALDYDSLDKKEKGLISYLKDYETITVKRLMHVLNLSQRRARRMLVKLTKEGYLRVYTHQKEDFYTLSE